MASAGENTNISDKLKSSDPVVNVDWRFEVRVSDQEVKAHKEVEPESSPQSLPDTSPQSTTNPNKKAESTQGGSLLVLHQFHQSRRIELPSSKVLIGDLKDKDNGFLLSFEKRKAVIKAVEDAKLRNESIVKIARTRDRTGEKLTGEKQKDLTDLENTLDLEYSVLVGPNNQYIALYKGKGESKIGSGDFGNVKFGQDLITGEWLAIKIPKEPKPLKDMSREEIEEMERESKITKEVEILKGTIQRKGKNNVEKIYSIQIYLRGNSLKEIIEKEIKEKQPILTLPDKLQLISTLVEDLAKIHAKNIIHGDVHDGNIMYDPVKKEARLLDFGRSRLVEPGVDSVEVPGRTCSKEGDIFNTLTEIYNKLLDSENLADPVIEKLLILFAPYDVSNTSKDKPSARELADKIKVIVDSYEPRPQRDAAVY